MTPRWTAEAVADLEDVLDYIVARNPSAAAHVAMRIDHSVEVLTEFPRAGRHDSETGCYEWPVPGVPLLLIYTIETDVIDIIAVFHTSRDPSSKRRP